jgi:hypothetical protein
MLEGGVARCGYHGSLEKRFRAFGSWDGRLLLR